MAEVYWIHLAEHKDITSEGYVGFTSKTTEVRYQQHLYYAYEAKYTLQNAINKYGDKLIVETLVVGPDDYCLDIENKLRPERNIGWNIDVGGRSGAIGRVASEETRKKQSVAKLGKKHSPEQCAAKSLYTKGRVHTEETRAKLSAALTGKKRSEDVKKSKK